MFSIHPDDALRLAEERARTIRETWPRPGLRLATAEGLRRLAAWLDPPPAPLRAPRRASPPAIQLRR
jgi:hypothetical protein